VPNKLFIGHCPFIDINILLLRGGKLHEVGFDESIEVAVHDSVDIRSLIVGAVVLHASVVKHVAAYLRTPFDFHLAGLDLGLLLKTVLQLLVVEYRAELTHGVLLVLGLVARLGVLDKDFFLLTPFSLLR